MTELIGIVGAGTMGAGIAQVALEHDHEVVLYDVDPAAIERARSRVRDGLAKRALRLELDADSIDAWVDGRLVLLRDAETLDAVAAQADVVIEAAREDQELKRTVFRTLDAETSRRPEVILATNTSALSVADIAGATARPERVVGLHFFNPAPVMPLVEVVGHAAVDPGVVDRAVDLVTRWDKTAVRCTDSPGFIVNRVNRPFTLEALRILDAGQGSIQDIDKAMTATGFPMGPFELMDLVGVDVNLAAATGVWQGLGRPERLQPSPIQERLVAAEQLGRKSGTGFYAYRDGRREGPGAGFEAGAGGAATTPSSTPATPDEIVARIVLAIVNEAHFAVGEEVAATGEIDLALRLGAGHPFGPFEWTASRGARAVLDDLLRWEDREGARFQPAPALRAAAEGCC